MSNSKRAELKALKTQLVELREELAEREELGQSTLSTKMGIKDTLYRIARIEG